MAANSLDGWLPAVLPVSVCSFRADDKRIAQTLLDAGGVAAQSEPDVEIAPAGALRGDAAHAVVCIDAAQSEGGSRLVRAPLRAAGLAEARVRALRARRALQRAGYGSTSTVMWDIDHVLYVPHLRASRRGRPLAELLPQRAVVSGTRGAEEPTTLQAAVGDAARAAGTTLTYGWPLARAGGIVVVADNGVLNVAVGPGRRKIEVQQTVLASLAGAPAAVTRQLPSTLAVGRSGLADWSLEKRMPGTSPHGEVSPTLARDAVEFLVALYGADAGAAPATSISGDADVLAEVCLRPENAERLQTIGASLERDLFDIPRGFGHGDFWTKNLLAVDERLTGVVDWDGAGAGRLPVLDLLHLLLSAHRDRTRQYLGSALVDHLLPWARSGGDDLVRSYLRQIDLELDPEQLERLAIAYWLDRMALEVKGFSDRARRPVWVRNNVDNVVAALAERSSLPA